MSFLEDQIVQSKTVAITGHTRPDGDSVGACMGLYNYIVENYPEIQVDVFLEPIAESYKLVKRTDEIRQPETHPAVYDLLVCLDNSQKDRITKGMEPYFDAAVVTVNVDHHISNTAFAQVNHVVAEASSASEVLFDLLDPEKIPLSAAEAIYMGIICDSGVFKYSSTSEHTMQIAGRLMSLGVDSGRWIDEVFYERTHVQARLLGQALLNSVCLFEGRCIYTVVTREMFKAFQAGPDDLEGIVEQLRLTKGIEAAILISETEEGTSKFSFRSKRYMDVNKIASLCGGGGHIRAAGCTVQGDWKESLNIFLEAIEGQLMADV